MAGPASLLVIGIHREELAFGEQVAAGLDPARVAVLRIGEGLSGRRPRPDERFHYDTLHRELYHQLLVHVRRGGYHLVIDLHTGLDRDGPCADLYCRDDALLACVERAQARSGLGGAGRSRYIPFLPPVGTPANGDDPHAAGVMPEQVWNNPAFRYVGLEVYLSENRPAGAREWDYARDLVNLLAECVKGV